MANEFKIRKGLIVEGASGGTVVDVRGSQGQLFSVTDDLSGSIFAVSDISGVPILDVNSSGLSTFSGDVSLADNKKLKFGDAPDFEIYHNSTTNVNHISSLLSRQLSISADTTAFTGDVLVEDNLYLTDAGTVRGKIQLNSSDRDNLDIKAISLGSLMRFYTVDTLALTLDDSQDATFAAQAFATTATSSGDASSTLTTKGYVDGLITGATIYRGAWDPSGGGYGSPDLSGVTQTSGYYYICSAAGTAEPNGTGTEPDSWAVGDWVIYNDVSGTGQWQKIDNSSVLSGVGTGQTVALWEGASSVTDSETLGNAPITVSGSNTTFAGAVSTGGYLTLNSSDNIPRLIFNGSGDDFFFSNTANYFGLYNDTDSRWDIKVDGAGNTTFAGDVGVGVSGGSNAKLEVVATSGEVFRADSNNGAYRLVVDQTGANIQGTLDVLGQVDIKTGNDLRLYRSDNATYARFNYSGASVGLDIDDLNGDGINLQQAGVNKLRIETSGNATFAGDTFVAGDGSVFGHTSALMTDSANTNYNIQMSDGIAFGGSAYTFCNIFGSNGNMTIAANAYPANTGSESTITFKNSTSSGGTHVPLVITGNNAAFAGKVGIGTTNPSTKLNVVGTGTQIGSTGYYYNAFFKDTTNSGVLTGGNNTNNGVGFLAGVNELAFLTFGTSWGERMRITGAGNVGIGTSTPNAKLDVQGTQGQLFSVTDDLSGDIFSVADISGVPIMSVNSNGVSYFDGPVGIGVPTPSTPYYLQMTSGAGANGDCILGISADADGTTPQSSPKIVMGKNGNANFFVIEMDDNHRTVFANTQGHYFQSGNVGIGTTSPSYKLHVKDTVNGNVNIAVENASTGTQAYASYRFKNNSISTAVMFLNGSNNTGYAGASSLNMYQGTSLPLGFVTNNLLRMTVTGGGNVGIGTASPDSLLHVSADVTGANKGTITIEGRPAGFLGDDVAAIDFHSNGSKRADIRMERGNTANDSQLVFSTSDTGTLNDALIINEAGDVGIGGNAPSYLLDVRDGTSSGAIARFSAINPHVIIESSTAGPAVLHLKPNQTGNKSGQFKVTAGNGYNFRWSNDAAGTGETTYMVLDTSTTGGGDLTVKGDIIAYGAPSDRKYKENIKPIESALDKAMQLQGVTFDWKDSESILDIKEDIGFIAQDVEKVLPELVRDNGKGNLSLRYQGITPVLLEAIKELKAEIDLLKSKPCNCNNCNCNI